MFRTANGAQGMVAGLESKCWRKKILAVQNVIEFLKDICNMRCEG